MTTKRKTTAAHQSAPENSRSRGKDLAPRERRNVEQIITDEKDPLKQAALASEFIARARYKLDGLLLACSDDAAAILSTRGIINRADKQRREQLRAGGQGDGTAG